MRHVVLETVLMVLCCGLICNCACRMGWQVLERSDLEGSLAFGRNLEKEVRVADGCCMKGSFDKEGYRGMLCCGSGGSYNNVHGRMFPERSDRDESLGCAGSHLHRSDNGGKLCCGWSHDSLLNMGKALEEDPDE